MSKKKKDKKKKAKKKIDTIWKPTPDPWMRVFDASKSQVSTYDDIQLRR